LRESINIIIKNINNILKGKLSSIYLYGSVTMEDFKLGWSDIDILCLTYETITDLEANELVNLRQTLLEDNKDNKYYRSFEGVFVSLKEFKEKQYTKVVYWGTSGQKITCDLSFDTFSLFQLIKYGELIYGVDIRKELILPTPNELKTAVMEHYNIIRKFGSKTHASLYSCGWLFDIARCIYTLRNNDIISKTNAGEWAIKEKLCPEENQMLLAIQIRNNPIEYKNNDDIKKWLCSLGQSIQLFADVLEIELKQ